MKFFIRTDASVAIGTGHVVRCLTLADELRTAGADIRFICRDEPGSMIPHIESKGYRVHRLPAGIGASDDAELCAAILEKETVRPDWLIVDHYGLDISWETRLKGLCGKLMVIDDLADRRHDCDLLLDQNLGAKERYDELAPAPCRKLLGPRYSLLRPQFRDVRLTESQRTGTVRRILVFMGGSDATNQTEKVLAALIKLGRPDIAVDVVMGATAPFRQRIESMVGSMQNARCWTAVEDMAELMAAADFSIGAGGSTTWERCSLGLPTLVIAVVPNQVAVSRELSMTGAIIYAGWHEDISVERLAVDLAAFLRYPAILGMVSARARDLVDARGTSRVAHHLLYGAATVRLRPARPDDSSALFQWRNDPEIRRQSFDPSPLVREEHEQWFAKTLVSTTTAVLIAEIGQEPIGVLRYDFQREDAVVSIYLSPSMMGRGLGKLILSEGNEWIKTNHQEIRRIRAEIKQDNKASMNAFLQSGFLESHRVWVYNTR